MRVLIDGTPLLLRSAGVKNYIYHWASALIRKAPHKLKSFLSLAAESVFEHEKSVLARSVLQRACLWFSS